MTRRIGFTALLLLAFQLESPPRAAASEPVSADERAEPAAPAPDIMRVPASTNWPESNPTPIPTPRAVHSLSYATAAGGAPSWATLWGAVLAQTDADNGFGIEPEAAVTPTTGLGVPRGRFRFLWENDSWFTESDRFYTNGIGLGWTFADGRITRAIADGLSWLPFAPDLCTARATEVFLRQDMYTPEDFTNPLLVSSDRPYAGWLHLDFSHQILRLDQDALKDRLDTWQVQLGVVGPSSLAKEAQTEVHRLVDAPRPRGWRFQLHDEPGLVMAYRRDFRAYYNPTTFQPFETDFVGNFGVRLGNVETSAQMGGEVRFGLNLSRHFDTAIRGPLLPMRHRLYASAGVEGRFVLQNIFLDGNTFRRSHEVDRNKFVADFWVGIHWEPCERARVSISEVFTTPEFDSPSQEGDLGHHTAVQIELFF
ncbi:MAG: lipid A deacylase LpxR family protein [Planctomycetota bacterium]